MPWIHPLKRDTVVVAIGPGQKYTLHKPALRALLSRMQKPRTERVPLIRVREGEAGDVTLSKSGRSIVIRVNEPGHPEYTLLASIREARAFLEGTIPSLLLHDAREEHAESDAMMEARRERIVLANLRLHEAVKTTQARLAHRPSRPPKE